jgi:hypothetical protein
MEMLREYKSDADKVKVYNHRLKQAQDMFDQWGKPAAEEWVGRYEGRPMKNQQTGKGHRVSVPDGTSIIDSLFSSMTAADVDIIAEAVGSGTLEQEELTTAAVSKEWDECKVNEHTAPGIKDSLLVGIGWAKTTYEYYVEEQELPRAMDDISMEIDAMLKQAEDAGSDIDFDTIAAAVPVTEVQETVLNAKVNVDYVPWDKMLFDPTAKTVEDIRWYAQVTLMPVEQVIENPVFKEYCKKSGTSKKLKDLRGDSTIDTSIFGDDAPYGVADEDTRVTVYEIADRETGTICTMARNADFFLNEAPNPLAINDHGEDWAPFVPLILRKSPGRVRGISEMELMLPTLRELDLYHSRLATFIERFAPKFLVEEGAISEAGKRALRSQEYGTAVEMKTGRVNDIKDLVVPQLPAEIFAVPDKLQQALREATGVNELMRGLFPDRKRTATETAEVVSASAARQAEKRVQLERWYTAIARRMLQLMQMFYTEDRMVRYMDWDGPVEWQWTADDIVFETKLEVSLTPKENKTRQSERDEAQLMLNTWGPLTQPDPATGVRMVDPTQLYRLVGKKFGLKRKELALLMPTPEEQQIQQLAAQQGAAGMASAQQGLVDPTMVPGPLPADELAAATNAGQVPPELIAAAQGIGPGGPLGSEILSEDLGVAGA